MKTFSFLLLILFLGFNETSLAQNPTLDKLKSNSDSAQAIFFGSATSNYSPSIFVNPFIGTGGHGHTFPGASAPFGMIQISPDTRYDGWDGCSGYHYDDSIIYGFSHTHLSGTGVPDYCDLLIVPQSKKANTTPGYLSPKGYGSKFSHTNEKASPGYYEVSLSDPKIKARIAVSDRAGIHSYTFENKNEKRFILIDLDHRDKLLDSKLEIVDKKTIQGYRISEGWATKQHFYFYLETSTPYKKAKFITENGQHKLLLEFPKDQDIIVLKVGISATSCEGAKTNLSSEITTWNMDEVRASTTKKWNNELGKIKISLEDKEKATIFYTALYHSYLAPNQFTDIYGNKYRGRDNYLHDLSKGQQQYTVFSLWDTYRATHPLFTLTQQKRTADFIQTFLRQYKEGKDLPVWELAANETECMIGYHSVSVIADAYLKGIRDFDTTLALEAMIATAKMDEFGKKFFGEQGFIAADQEPESVSRTLEYAYDDYCIAEMAKKMVNSAVESEFRKRSYNFLNVFDANTKFMRAKRGAQWYGPFDPSEVNFNYTEANSWQYSMAAPHAINELTKHLGGKDSLEAWLDRLFTTSSSLSGREQADITGLIGQYAHGNEPSHHMAYLYNYTNAPHKTQLYVDRILNEMYSNKPDGLSGNEDCGQMSAWYVLSSLGFYPVAPGKPYYELGKPNFKQQELKFENGATLFISAPNLSSENIYVQSVKLNGKPLNRSYVSHDELTYGGLLEFEMGNQPRIDFDKWIAGSPEAEIPETFVPIPYLGVTDRIFKDRMKVGIGYLKLNEMDDFIPMYRLNESDWIVYEKPFIIDKTSKIDIRLQRRINPRKIYHSAEVSTMLSKKDPTIQLNLQTQYANQYAASGPNSLIDGIKGGNEFRTGDWQGFFGTDVKAEVTFDSLRNLSQFGVSVIRDQKSWIFFPSQIEIEVSADGKTFQKLAPIQIKKADPTDKNPENIEFVIDSYKPSAIKAIRYTIKNPGVCPDWHLGKGNKTWLFLDELIFR
jgi:predicted alpha-1,2-mannosidase